MEYNTQRERLPMPEYGRSVQEMVDFAVGIEDRAERQRCAEAIIDIMWGMFPSYRDIKDFQVKLWDHLAYMSGYRLDVDYPYPVTRLDVTKQTPERISYSNGKIAMRHYGKIVPELILKASSLPQGPERDQLIRLIAVQMKKDLLIWNKEMAGDDRIVDDLREFSNGLIQIESGNLDIDVPRLAANQNQMRTQKQGQRRKNRKRY